MSDSHLHAKKSLQEHMRRVVVDPSADVRADIAKTVAEAFALNTLAESEKKLAVELFAAMVCDVEIGRASCRERV